MALVPLLLGRTDCRIVLVGSGVQHRQLERILEENGRDPRIINLAGDQAMAMLSDSKSHPRHAKSTIA
jgi:hypothetical protein